MVDEENTKTLIDGRILGIIAVNKNWTDEEVIERIEGQENEI